MQKREFGLSVRKLRARAGLSQRELAEKVGVDFSYLSKIENGVLPPPSQEVILKLAEALEADKDELLALAGKVPEDIAQILKDRDVLQSLRGRSARRNAGAANNEGSFSKRLKQLRETVGLSQAGLAERVGVGYSYLSKIESGAKPPPSEKVILKLAEALGCDGDELMSLAGKVPSDVARILKSRKVRQSLRKRHAKRVSAAGNREGISMMKQLLNGRSLVRIALSLVLVLATAVSLWFSSPSAVKALKMEITNLAGAPLETGTLGQTYYFRFKITIEDGELLPITNIDLSVFNSANATGYVAILSNLPLVHGASANYTAAQTGGGPADVSVATANLTRLFGYGYAVWGGYGYRFPGGYGYGGLAAPATITYTVAWTPPPGWPVGGYKIKAVIAANGAAFTQLSGEFTLQTGLMAETSIAQRLSASAPGIVVVKTDIDRIKNPTDNSTANITGGIGSYSAIASGSPASTIQFLTVYGVPPFLSPSFNATTGVFSVASVASPIQAANTTVAEVAAILTGNATSNVSLTIAFYAIGAAGQAGVTVPEEHSNTIVLLRGDALADGQVNIIDVLSIAQYIVGQKQLSALNPLNAASVRHDGAGGDRIDIVDALFILRYVVEQLNAYYQ